MIKFRSVDSGQSQSDLSNLNCIPVDNVAFSGECFRSLGVALNGSQIRRALAALWVCVLLISVVSVTSNVWLVVALGCKTSKNCTENDSKQRFLQRNLVISCYYNSQRDLLRKVAGIGQFESKSPRFTYPHMFPIRPPIDFDLTI